MQFSPCVSALNVGQRLLEGDVRPPRDCRARCNRMHLAMGAVVSTLPHFKPREFFIDNLLVRLLFVIEMIW